MDPNNEEDQESASQAKTEREITFYKEIFMQLMDIVEAIMGQMFDRVSVIPYAIRSFCKCIY